MLREPSRGSAHPGHVAVYLVEASPVGHGRGLRVGKVLVEECEQVHPPGAVGADKVQELVAVVEHYVLVDVARAEDAVVEDEPLSKTHACSISGHPTTSDTHTFPACK
jgi:hypothetical protein